jgi:hypothetical protein
LSSTAITHITVVRSSTARRACYYDERARRHVLSLTLEAMMPWHCLDDANVKTNLRKCDSKFVHEVYMSSYESQCGVPDTARIWKSIFMWRDPELTLCHSHDQNQTDICIINISQR